MCPTVTNPDLNVVGSRLGQIIQMEWFLLPEVFQLIHTRWNQSHRDLFVTSFNNKLPHFVSPLPDFLAWAVDALSLPWEDLDPYVFTPMPFWERQWRNYER